MRAVLSLCLVFAAGCYAQADTGVQIRRGLPRGGEIEGSIGDDRLRLGLGAVGFAAARPGGNQVGAGEVDTTLTVSAIALIRGAHRDAAPWIDVGGHVGYGVGGTAHDVIISGIAGGWADVRLSRSHASYPTLHLAVDHIVYTDGPDNENAATIGVGWVVRDPHASWGMH